MNVRKLPEMWVWPFSRALYFPSSIALWKSLRISSIWRFPTHLALWVVARNPSRAAFHTTICLRKSASDPGQIAWNAEEQQMNKSQGMWERKKWPKLGVGFSFFGSFFFFFFSGKIWFKFWPLLWTDSPIKKEKKSYNLNLNTQRNRFPVTGKEERTYMARAGEKIARGGNFLGSASWVQLVTSKRG